MYRSALDAQDDQIRAAHAAIAERDRLVSMSKNLKTDLGAAEQQVTALSEKLDDEQRDVARYEGGVWAFLYGLFANREARLSKESAEALEAEARYREAVSTRERLAEEIAALEVRIAKLKDAEAQLAAARAVKQHKLIQEGSPAGKELDSISRELGGLDAERKSIDEAIAAGRRAVESLNRLMEVLGSARNWGVADIMTDSFLISWAKRNKLDDARNIAGSAQAELTVFQRELGDVGMSLNAEIAGLADHHRFLDTWFDNIFSDVSVQGRIDQACATTRATLNDAQRRMSELGGRKMAAEQRSKQLAETRRRLLEPSST